MLQASEGFNSGAFFGGKERMKAGKKRSKVLETRFFGLIIALMVIVLFLAVNHYTVFFSNIENKILDLHFRYKDVVSSRSIQEGVSVVAENPNINKDILIVGIDFRSLNRLGRWPFPRSTHAALLNTFSRIQDQSQRERSVFLDIFFNEPASDAIEDVLLIESISENRRVFLETLLDEVPPPDEYFEELFSRQEVLNDVYGSISNIAGDWKGMHSFPGVQPPLKPYSRHVAGYGHANYLKDSDEVFRRQPLVMKLSRLVEEIPFREIIPGFSLDEERFQRLVWTDEAGQQHTIDYPITEEVLNSTGTEIEARSPQRVVDLTGDGEPDDSYHIVRLYEDTFIPSITLALALDYFNKSIDDIEVHLGKHIYIPHPQYYDANRDIWVPYEIVTSPAVFDEEGNLEKEASTRVLQEIEIPIDEHGQMLINFMGAPSFATPGARQTFPIRSYSGYAGNPPGLDPADWPRTRALTNKIVMVGAFARGIADDEKPTPYGLMYGVEIHANALNTILMNKFIYNVPFWIDALILVFLVLLVSILSSRFSTVWAFGILLLAVAALFITSSILFDREALLINFTTPALASSFSFLSIIAYRAMTEEKDKRRIRSMFGTYVSPKVVAQILDNPPELGGLDKELTVFFSDIRGFTTLSESMTPQELVKILNRYLTAMTDIVLEHEGTLDKYEGDAIMCFWGAPLPQEDHALRACTCAVQQLRALEELNAQLPEARKFDIGIGINSGIMTVGNMGSTQRMDYTLIGDNVNLGARLEGTNKQYQTNIIISEYTYGLVKDKVIARELDNIRVKGKSKPVLIYELLDYIEEEA
jgi:adenylate cyclase